MAGGAPPFLVDRVNCQVNFVNERDLSLLNSESYGDTEFLLLRIIFGCTGVLASGRL